MSVEPESAAAAGAASNKLVMDLAVSYRDVDRDEVVLLSGVFKLLQEAAVAHANRYNVGTAAISTSGESWVLHRIAVAIHRYPRYEERLRIETWSTGIKAFKGYRDFRVYDATDELVISGSSLWLYVNLKTKAIVRVPRDVAERFPARLEEAFEPALETLTLPSPDAAGDATPVTVRYSDVDANHHVNNTAYLDYLQTALARRGLPLRPREIRLKFGKGIPADATEVRVTTQTVEPGRALFGIDYTDTTAAQGELRW